MLEYSRICSGMLEYAGINLKVQPALLPPAFSGLEKNENRCRLPAIPEHGNQIGRLRRKTFKRGNMNLDSRSVPEIIPHREYKRHRYYLHQS